MNPRIVVRHIVVGVTEFSPFGFWEDWRHRLYWRNWRLRRWESGKENDE